MAQPGDPSSKQPKCSRCDDKSISWTMSKFNFDWICLTCKEDERLAPGYANADNTEVSAVRAGYNNFPGVGLTLADRVFLAQRVAARPRRASKWVEASEGEDA